MEERALVCRGQETASEIVQAAGGNLATIQHHVAGKIFVEAAQAVSDPSPHARTALEAEAAVQKVIRAGVLWEFRGERTDHADIVHALADVRKEVAHEGAALSTWLEFPTRLEQRALLIG